jgi:hypothetical protein
MRRFVNRQIRNRQSSQLSEQDVCVEKILPTLARLRTTVTIGAGNPCGYERF